ncbi:uridine kinase [Thermoactinomyces vulgaris]|jgi:uridine kinase|uniref:Uridine kinase n=2 Tax=Thermoactinomycetaceae TaxID=186824 RepID=A0ABS0QJP8_THEVU|nr:MULTISPECIES: uridine kinase [Thermoactinomyces]KFZ41469.1 uridine kinase [Thermoactinomyces sp. Gus2-1]KYQ86462.1 uridine kinase [Thermoactinomyces sp. AS95]MBA4551961.1 uridine kinase [Thermoactinomyces vulgaris]MBA4596759.1 uridine kinase [Thermoactinomyces vulgaris]MBH8583303.1 uridine kinase [Thermoactinomyces sp. CICC 10735]
MSTKPVIIGVAGGTGSGKTTIAKKLVEQFSESVVYLEQDSYYKDQSHLPFEERIKTNYDHPLAFDNDLLYQHLLQLKTYQPVQKPVYDYARHTRAKESVHLEPKDVIILEGILILEDERLRNLMDIKIFVDTDADVRILRRIDRDIKERGRDLDSVINQYLTVVRPMHMQFIEPSKRYADIIIPEGGHNQVAINLLLNQIRTYLQKAPSFSNKKA